MQFSWISARLLIRFHIITWQSSSITMGLETRTYPGSKVSLQIGIIKLSLMGRYLFLQLTHLEFHRVQYSDLFCSWYTSMACPQQFPHQYDFFQMIVYYTEFFEGRRMQSRYKLILTIYRNTNKRNVTQTSITFMDRLKETSKTKYLGLTNDSKLSCEQPHW